MCGIFSILNYNCSDHEIKFHKKNFMKSKNRGPDNSIFNDNDMENFVIGFHRLSINGLDNLSNQPIIFNNITLICNGEIYNYKEIYKTLNITSNTNSDCEIIIHLYLKFKDINYILNLLDGVFSFVLFDFNNEEPICFVARDPFGVRPLYKINDTENLLYGFSSELKSLSDYSSNRYSIQQFEPGTYSCFTLKLNKWKSNKKLWTCNINNYKYNQFGFSSILSKGQDILTIYEEIRVRFLRAVIKRVKNTDRPVACLLSGGLDSSLVASIVNIIHKKIHNKPVETYSIGLANSPDLKYAKICANYIGSKHNEYVISEDDFFNHIPEVIYNIESYDTTTVRASVGNYLIAKYISNHSDAKVIFNGDGSDELMGGYLYFKKCPNKLEFDFESRRLLKDIHYFDVLRSDRSISTNGLEARTPFLDRDFTQYYLSIDPAIRFSTNKICEKYIFRKAFDTPLYYNIDDIIIDTIPKKILPHNILWRKKEAFSDGVSNETRSWHEIIKEKINILNDNSNIFKFPFLTGDIILNGNILTLEQEFYFKIFKQHYKDNLYMNIPYYWMPKYVNATDSSARTLNI